MVLIGGDCTTIVVLLKAFFQVHRPPPIKRPLKNYIYLLFYVCEIKWSTEDHMYSSLLSVLAIKDYGQKQLWKKRLIWIIHSD